MNHFKFGKYSILKIMNISIHIYKKKIMFTVEFSHQTGRDLINIAKRI